MKDFTFDQVRYLTSKTSVDDRALNRAVWGSFTEAVSHLAGPRLTMVELGAGTGSTLGRLLDRRFFGHLGPGCTAVDLELLDHDARALERARRGVPVLARAHRWSCAETAEGWRLQQGVLRLDVRCTVMDVHEFVREMGGGRYDVLLAHAFLDLFHLPTFVPSLLGTLAAGGLFYATLNYDGATIFEPVTDRGLEDAIHRSYNRAMDGRISAGQPSGDSAAGRHLYHVLTGSGAAVLDLGSSDWAVFPFGGDYPDDEEYFLRCILWLVGQALEADTELSAAAVEGWLRRREEQVRARELLYIAHQLDVLARVGPVAVPNGAAARQLTS